GVEEAQSSTGEVNVGGRQITGVAAGSADTDVVNVQQLRALNERTASYADERVQQVEQGMSRLRSDVHTMDRELRAGIAAAMATAGLPQAYLPGRNMVSFAGGTWNGESGYALGVSRVSSSGNWVAKAAANGSSRGDFGATVGVGYQW